jgi:transposase, IS5 family
MRFLELGLHDTVPDARTIWLLREHLIKASAVEKLFTPFDAMPNAAGFAASGGQIIDAMFVEVPRQRGGRDDNETIKNGEGPDVWSERKKTHKVTDASVPARVFVSSTSSAAADAIAVSRW